MGKMQHITYDIHCYTLYVKDQWKGFKKYKFISITKNLILYHVLHLLLQCAATGEKGFWGKGGWARDK